MQIKFDVIIAISKRIINIENDIEQTLQKFS